MESELIRKIIDLEIQHNITQDKKDWITQTLMLQLQKLEEKCSTSKSYIESKLKNILLVKLREDISTIKKAVLGSISTVNKTAQKVIDLKVQLPFLFCSFSYPSFHDYQST